MARIRTIKPEFWTSEQVAECSPTARLLFIGLWNFCDDAGRHPDSAMRIKMQIFPADLMNTDDIEVLLGQLFDAELITRYAAQGKQYIQVTGWHHQKIEKPNIRYPSPNDIGMVADHSPNGSPRNRKGMEGNGYIRSTVEGDQMRPLTEEEIGVVRERSKEIFKRIGKPKGPQDQSLVTKCAMLSMFAPFSEAWLYGAAEGVTRSKSVKRNKYSYFTKCLKDGAEKIGRILNSELAKILVPQELATPPPTLVAHGRLCDPDANLKV